MIRKFLSVIALTLIPISTLAQTELHITGPQSGFPIAVPRMCDAGSAGSLTEQLSSAISRNLQISSYFKVLNPSTFVETPGKCTKSDELAFSDWSVIGAEGLVKGDIVKTSSDNLTVTLYLYDIHQRKAVVGKRYQGEADEFNKIADRFSNEIIKYFTGEAGVFGTKIAFVGKVGRFKELFLMNIDGSGLRKLTKDKGLIVSPSWSPNGEKIIYTSYRSKRPELYTVNPRTGRMQQLTKRNGLDIGAKFAPNGRSIMASSSANGHSNLVHLDLRGNVKRLVTKGWAIDVSPSFSPDGSEIVFCSNRGGGPQIYKMAAEGGKAKRISFTGSGYCTSPSWSPKGDKVAYVCQRGGNQLFVYSFKTKKSVQLTFHGNNEEPSWSPDGRFIAFSTNFGKRGARNIGITSIDRGAPTQISFSKSQHSQPSWSPRLD